MIPSARRRPAVRLALAAVVLAGVLAGCDEGGERAEVILASGEATNGGLWRVTASSVGSGSTQFEQGNEVGSASAYADPPILNEASWTGAQRGRRDVTLIYGPVVDSAVAVEVTTSDGPAPEARVVKVGSMQFFITEVDGLVGISDIVARDESGDVVDEWTLPDSPPAHGG